MDIPVGVQRKEFQRKHIEAAENFSGSQARHGDLNSNKIWDSSRTLNHSALVNRLRDKFNLHSVYHHHFAEEQGKESRPTLCFTYNEKKAYHIDYIFIPEKWLSRIKSVELGEFKNWKHLSDHCPLIVDIDL